MIYKYKYNEFIKLDKNVACIGNFDGVHRGHQELISKTIELAKKKHVRSMVISFDPHPREVLTKQEFIKITTIDERIKLIQNYGIDDVLIIKFDDDFKNLSKEEFISLLKSFNIDSIVCGKYFRFGAGGKGNANTFKENGIDVVVLEEKNYYGSKISSTRIRQAIEKGNYKLVEKLLGHEYR